MTQKDYENLGSKIKALRLQMNLTQAEVAASLNVTPGYISNVENNRTAMSLRILIYYAKLMNISLDTLVGKIDSEYRPTALDREIMEELFEMSDTKKEKLLRTIRLWKKIRKAGSVIPGYLFLNFNSKPTWKPDTQADNRPAF